MILTKYLAIQSYLEAREMDTIDLKSVEPFLEEVVKGQPYIQFIYIVDTDGKKITKNITQAEDLEGYEKKGLDSSFSNRPWFKGPMQSKNIHVTGLYTSRITDKLCITVSAPIRDNKDKIVGILGIDLKFEDLAKL